MLLGYWGYFKKKEKFGRMLDNLIPCSDSNISSLASLHSDSWVTDVAPPCFSCYWYNVRSLANETL